MTGVLRSNLSLYYITQVTWYSLIAPVQTCRDVLFDIPHAVVSQVTNQNLPPKVQNLIHHMPQSVKQISFIFLWGKQQGRKAQLKC